MEKALLLITVLLGAVIWAIVNVVNKRYLKEDINFKILLVILMYGASCSCFLIQFIFLGVPNLTKFFWMPLAVTAILNIGIQFFRIKSLKLEDASIVESVFGLGPLFTVLTAWIILGEKISWLGFIGVLIIIIGAYILGRSKSGEKSCWRRLFSSKGVRLMFLATILASVAINFDKLTVVASSPMMLTAGVFFVCGSTFLIYLIIKGEWQMPSRKYFLTIFGAGLLLGVANALMNTGFYFGQVPYISALKRTVVIWTAILAALFLKEDNLKGRLGAALLIVIGIVLLAF